MRILHIRLVNFIGVYAAMGLKEIELDFSRNEKPIIQLYGKNRCGKTVMIQQMHPYSTINLSGDERSDLPLILKGEVGLKNIVYEVGNEVYDITHTYKPTKTNHTVSSSVIHNGEELNPSGGVTTFNNLIEKILGINKYSIQFIINGTQLTSIANMNGTQRKTLLNKAMGIDIYSKIHQMSTEDYRYTSKRISAINNSIEHMLSNYGSYENFTQELKKVTDERDAIYYEYETINKDMIKLQGIIDALRSQNVGNEMREVEMEMDRYRRVVDQYGSYDESAYDRLIDEQIELNAKLNGICTEITVSLNSLDNLYEKREALQSKASKIERAIEDRERMKNLVSDLKSKMDTIEIPYTVHASSDKLLGMMSLGQAINSTCNEIVLCINGKHLKLFCDMINKGIDVSAFIATETSALAESEKEKEAISRMRAMINNAGGETFDCGHENCVYYRSYEMLQSYFRSYQSKATGEFTLYDIDQMDHAYKNVLTIRRLLNIDIPEDLRNEFEITAIMTNIANGKYGIDIDHIKELIEVAGCMETRDRLKQQYDEACRTLKMMEELDTSGMDKNGIDSISTEIDCIIKRIDDLKQQQVEIRVALDENNRKKTMLSQIKGINVVELSQKLIKTKELWDKLTRAENEYASLKDSLSVVKEKFNTIDILWSNMNATNRDYNEHMNDMKCNSEADARYKIIAEATSSTKGKPVIAIRDTIKRALHMTNRLLDVMYNGEIKMLKPEIDESSFSLPFRCGCNNSPDIKFGSQSESTLLSLALSLSLASSLTEYNIPLVDEIDAYIDAHMRESFLMMLQEIMSTLKMEQLFLISHSISPDQYEPIIHEVNLSEIIAEQKED